MNAMDGIDWIYLLHFLLTVGFDKLSQRRWLSI
jgi:hypothetical protein